MARAISTGGKSEYSSVAKAKKERMQRDIEYMNKVIARKKQERREKRGY